MSSNIKILVAQQPTSRQDMPLTWQTLSRAHCHMAKHSLVHGRFWVCNENFHLLAHIEAVVGPARISKPACKLRVSALPDRARDHKEMHSDNLSIAVQRVCGRGDDEEYDFSVMGSPNFPLLGILNKHKLPLTANADSQVGMLQHPALYAFKELPSMSSCTIMRSSSPQGAIQTGTLYPLGTFPG
jgi:hypothetical protein